MGKYGTCAEIAAGKTQQGIDPVSAWKEAADAVFPNTFSSRKKGCPRDAFLGLCEDGLVRGIRRGSYTRSRLNKLYAVRAVSIINQQRGFSWDEYTLWHRVQDEAGKTHNAQMDVVLALWRKGLLEDC